MAAEVVFRRRCFSRGFCIGPTRVLASKKRKESNVDPSEIFPSMDRIVIQSENNRFIVTKLKMHAPKTVGQK